jgi:NADH:ubiquinone oxidoreductase subunit E
MDNLAEALPLEQARVREVLTFYEEIPQGIFGATMIKIALQQAEKAAASGDVVAMVKAYKELQAIE